MKAPQKALNKWFRILGLKGWAIQIFEFPPEEFNIAAAAAPGTGYDCSGFVQTYPLTLEAHITVTQGLGKEDLDEAILHECVHIVNQPCEGFVADLLASIENKSLRERMEKEWCEKREQTVTKLTRAIMEAYKEKPRL